MTIISSKKQVSKGVRNLSAKAMSWSQVCKQISGIGGYVEIDEGVKVRPLELMQSLGVHVTKNSYTPKDIFTAWSGYMIKDGVCKVAKNVPYTVVVDGKERQLFTAADITKGVKRFELCSLVSATDKKKGSTDVAVTAQNILRGLQQGVYISDTLGKIEKSASDCEALAKGWVNMAEKRSDEPKWMEVVKCKDGNWSVKVIKGGKKNMKKAA